MTFWVYHAIDRLFRVRSRVLKLKVRMLDGPIKDPGSNVTSLTTKRQTNMFLSLVLLSQITAKVVFDKYDHPAQLTVRSGGHTYITSPQYGSKATHFLQNTVTIGKCEITAKGNTLVGSNGSGAIGGDAISKRLFPNVPQKYDFWPTLRSKGGLRIDDIVLWIFSWDAVDTMSEPSGETFAVEVKLDESGSITSTRSAPLRGLGPHLLGIDMIQFGDRVVLTGYGISIFDLRDWKETLAITNGEGRISPTGHVYWIRDGFVSRYDPSNDSFKMKGGPNLGYALSVFIVGGEDVVICQHGMFTPETRASYRFPGPDNTPMFGAFYVVPDIGIGFLGDFPKETPGILLSPKYLSPLTMIRRG